MLLLNIGLDRKFPWLRNSRKHCGLLGSLIVVTLMSVFHALERRSRWYVYVLAFAGACSRLVRPTAFCRAHGHSASLRLSGLLSLSGAGGSAPNHCADRPTLSALSHPDNGLCHVRVSCGLLPILVYIARCSLGGGANEKEAFSRRSFGTAGFSGHRLCRNRESRVWKSDERRGALRPRLPERLCRPVSRCRGRSRSVAAGCDDSG